MSRKRVIVVTVGIMLSLFMAAVESTVVATAMPTIVSELGGLACYSWVFSAYMLTSTTTVPIYGKLSDIYGRRPVFMVAMALFLVGSVLCGQSQNMGQLIAFRALQGLGAGGLMPLAFIMIGDMFSFEQRARMQGLFSGVWGVASIVGPLAGRLPGRPGLVALGLLRQPRAGSAGHGAAVVSAGGIPRASARAPAADRLRGPSAADRGRGGAAAGAVRVAEAAGRRVARPGRRAVRRRCCGSSAARPTRCLPLAAVP